MTLRQQQFARAYAKGYSATEAAILAGYSSASAASNAYKLLKNEDIIDLVQTLTTENQAMLMQQYNLCNTSMQRLLEQPDLSYNQRLRAQEQIVQFAKVIWRTQARLSTTLMRFSDTEEDPNTPELDILI